MKLGALGTHEAGGGSLPKRRGNQPWLPWWCSGKNPPANAGDAGDAGSILGSESPGGGNGNPLQYACLENAMDTGGWWATVQGVPEKGTWL